VFVNLRESRGGDEDGGLGERMRCVIKDGNLMFHGFHFARSVRCHF